MLLAVQFTGDIFIHISLVRVTQRLSNDKQNSFPIAQCLEVKKLHNKVSSQPLNSVALAQFYCSLTQYRNLLMILVHY
jgi:hypothetical protein